MSIINESGLYSLILTSRKPQAKSFKTWVTSEVLPAIRKTGKYEAETKPKTKLDLYKSWQETATALVESEEQRLLLESQNNELQAEVEQLAEICDELFDYSSILRVAKYNQVSENLFTWRTLKQLSENLQLEIKKAPCPRYGEKNLYHHDVWRIAYSDIDVPEVNMIVRGEFSDYLKGLRSARIWGLKATQNKRMTKDSKS